MATTYNFISSNTLASNAASVTLSSIPGTYTDLVLKASIRTTASGAFSNLGLVLNSDTGTKYSFIRMLGAGGAPAVGSSTFSGQNAGDVSYGNGDTSTANIFSNIEIYIPSYTVSMNKTIITSSVQENNQSIAYIYNHGQLFENTAAITSIQITEASGNNLKTGSTFYLYGISNA